MEKGKKTKKVWQKPDFVILDTVNKSDNARHEHTIVPTGIYNGKPIFGTPIGTRYVSDFLS